MFIWMLMNLDTYKTHICKIAWIYSKLRTHYNLGWSNCQICCMDIFVLCYLQIEKFLLSSTIDIPLWFSFQALAKKDPVRRQVLRVKGCLAGSKAENLLEQGDMILAINKEPITCFLDIEKACQELDQSIGSDGVLNMTIFRQVRITSTGNIKWIKYNSEYRL